MQTVRKEVEKSTGYRTKKKGYSPRRLTAYATSAVAEAIEKARRVGEPHEPPAECVAKVSHFVIQDYLRHYAPDGEIERERFDLIGPAGLVIHAVIWPAGLEHGCLVDLVLRRDQELQPQERDNAALEIVGQREADVRQRERGVGQRERDAGDQERAALNSDAREPERSAEDYPRPPEPAPPPPPSPAPIPFPYPTPPFGRRASSARMRPNL